MKAFLATIWSVIAAGVLLIAYALLSPRAAAAPYGAPNPDAYQFARPLPVNDVVSLNDQAYDRRAYDRKAYDRYVATSDAEFARAYPATIGASRTIQPVRAYPASHRAATRATIGRSSARTWQKTALVIGGSTAAGAGLGAIFGGKKGALIGAAIGGGGSGLYEAMKRR